MNVTASAYKMIRHIVAPSLSVLVGTWLLLCASLVPAHAQLSGAVTDQFRAAMQDCGSGLPCLNAMMVASAVPLTTTQSLNQLFLGAFQSCGGVPCLTITNAAGSGMVTTSGAPVAGQTAEFTSATAITGVATTGTGSYVKNTSPSLLGTTTATRLSFTGAPVYDLASNILAVSIPIPLDTADHTIPASDAFDHIRISQTTGANNTFTVGANATVTGYRALLTLNSGSDSTAAMYGATYGITNAGPGSAKAVHGAVSASGASTGVLVAFNAQIVPVATTNALSSAVQVSLTSVVGAHDVVTGMNIGSSGDRFLYGIGSPGGPVPYGKAAFHAWMATGSSAGADFLRLDNNAGTTIYHVDKSGNEFAQQISLRDTSAAFDVTLAAVSSVALTAGRTLTLDMGNVAHTLAFGTTANTITFPNAASGTVGLLNLAQTWSATNTFSAAPTVNGLNVQTSGIISPASTDANFLLYARDQSLVTTGGIYLANLNTMIATSGAQIHVQEITTFAPTSGSATFASVALTPTINQTGGANGITRALYINPTVTAAADFRAIDAPLGKIFFGGLSTSAGAQQDVLCLNASTEVIADTVACIASSQRYKQDIEPLTGALAEVMALRPVSYRYTDAYLGGKHDLNHGTRQVGLLAENMYDVDRRLVVFETQGPFRGAPRAVRYENAVALAFGAIQELTREVRELQRHVSP